MSDTKPVIAHHPYEAQREDEISFEKDELIQVVDDSDPDWWVGKKKDGTSGYFPSTEASKEETHEEEEQVEEPKEVEETAKADKVIGMARVMEDYAMQEAGEISLHRGGIVNVYEVLDESWARGELNGKIGKYPTKYVEDIDVPGRPDLGKQEAPQGTANEEEQSTAPKGGFKLAAFGVKQGGIGSLFAGGLPGLKKAPAKHEEPTPEEPKQTKTSEEPESKISEESKQPKLALDIPKQNSDSEAPKSLGKAIVLHPYDADGEDEINLLRGEYVEVVDREADEGWWKGTNERGETGVFPSNFVKELEQDIVAPPTPVRSSRLPATTTSGSAKPSTARPVSVQTGSTTRPISVQSPAPRPSTVQVLSNAPVVIPPKPPVVPHEAIEEQQNTEPEKEEQAPLDRDAQSPVDEIESESQVDQSSLASESVQTPVEQQPSTVVEEPQLSPSIPKREDSTDTSLSPVEQEPSLAEEPQLPPSVPKRQDSTASASSLPPAEQQTSLVEQPTFVNTPQIPPSPPKREDSTTSATSLHTVEQPTPFVEEKRPPVPQREDSAASATSLPSSERQPSLSEETGIPPSIPKRQDSTINADEQERSIAQVPPSIPKRQDSASVSSNEQPSVEKVQFSEHVSDEPSSTPVEPSNDTPSVEVQEKETAPAEASTETSPVETEKKEEHVTEETKEEAVEDKEELEDLPSGPKLTTPTRARIGGARRPRQVKNTEPSQTEILQKEVSEAPEEERKPSPPAKPVKPIFAKFPTPFAVGAEDLGKRTLRPTQTRKPWEQEEQKSEEEETPRPVGVRNLASRFNVSTNSGNEVLETKLKNHTKNEVEKVKKEFEQLLHQERERTSQLESLVQELLERVKQLEK